jgi:hypothetical protein
LPSRFLTDIYIGIPIENGESFGNKKNGNIQMNLRKTACGSMICLMIG